MSPAIYKKLPGTGHQIGSYTKLYRGADHLLQVSSVSFSERYKRFYFRDIQAFIVVRTIWWLIWVIIASVPSLFMAAFALGTDVTSTRIVFGIAAGVFTLIAISHAVRGPSCRCYVRTAVQTEVLPSLNRLRTTNRMLAELTPVIHAAQGPLPGPEGRIEPSSPTELSPASPAEFPPNPPSSENPPAV